MSNIVVTKSANVQRDEAGEILYDDDGDVLLHDEDDVGILVKTHVIQVNQLVDNLIQTGVIPKAEIYWNLHRQPAPALVDPMDLVWLSVDDGAVDDEEEVEGDDDNFESDASVPLDA